MFMGIKTAVMAAVGGGLIVLLTTAWLYYSNTQETIETLRETTTRMESALQSSQNTINSLQENIERNRQLRENLEINLRQAEEYQDTLLGKLINHDLTRLSAARPGLIETRINDATKEVFDNFESVTSE